MGLPLAFLRCKLRQKQQKKQKGDMTGASRKVKKGNGGEVPPGMLSIRYCAYAVLLCEHASACSTTADTKKWDKLESIQYRVHPKRKKRQKRIGKVSRGSSCQGRLLSEEGSKLRGGLQLRAVCAILVSLLIQEHAPSQAEQDRGCFSTPEAPGR